VDENKRMFNAIKAIPTVMAVKNGKVVHKIVGARTEIERRIMKIL
jgi:thioredoxin-like negative regulator of GroEL